MRLSTSTASANCGSSFGCENDVTSSFGNPAATIRLIISTLSSVETSTGMDCRPSRAQHSQAMTEAGRLMRLSLAPDARAGGFHRERVRLERGGHAAEVAAEQEVDAERVAARLGNQRVDILRASARRARPAPHAGGPDDPASRPPAEVLSGDRSPPRPRALRARRATRHSSSARGDLRAPDEFVDQSRIASMHRKGARPLLRMP